MIKIIIFLIGVVIGGVWVWRFVQRKYILASAVQNFSTKHEEKRERRREKILRFLDVHNEVANNDIEELFGVSDATAERYLNELEKEGKIKQIGKTGRSVVYRKINE